MQDVPGGLYEVASRFGAAGRNIEYAYASRITAASTLIVYISNTEIMSEQMVENCSLDLVWADQ